MTSLIGNERAQQAFLAAMHSETLHHAWLIVGPQGVGKGTFARLAAMRMLANATGDSVQLPGFEVSHNSQIRSLIKAGSHPDYRVLTRAPKDPEKPGEDLARSIPIAQVRSLQPLFATTPSLSSRRVVIIDAIDDLERGAANALLKNLEEPPAGTIFLLVSHAPGRLLPTIRSRCRILRFEALSSELLTSELQRRLPEAPPGEIAAIVARAEGSLGRALDFAGLDIAGLDQALDAIAQTGDPSNAERLKLARSLALKAQQRRYEAFLDRAPAFIAAAAARRSGERLRTALDVYQAARSLAASARGLSLDQKASVYEMAGLVARLRL